MTLEPPNKMVTLVGCFSPLVMEVPNLSQKSSIGLAKSHLLDFVTDLPWRATESYESYERWFQFNPFGKIWSSQIGGSFPKGSGWKFPKNIWVATCHHLVKGCQWLQKHPWHLISNKSKKSSKNSWSPLFTQNHLKIKTVKCRKKQSLKTKELPYVFLKGWGSLLCCPTVHFESKFKAPCKVPFPTGSLPTTIVQGLCRCWTSVFFLTQKEGFSSTNLRLSLKPQENAW